MRKHYSAMISSFSKQKSDESFTMDRGAGSVRGSVMYGGLCRGNYRAGLLITVTII